MVTVKKRPLLRLSLVAKCLEFFWGVGIGIGTACVDELLSPLSVYVKTLALGIGGVWAAYTKPFVWSNAKNMEAFEKMFCAPLYFTFFIGVFEAKNKLAIEVPSDKVGEEAGANIANVEEAGWAWCEAGAYSGHIEVL
jgi:hypothetical protein